MPATLRSVAVILMILLLVISLLLAGLSLAAEAFKSRS